MRHFCANILSVLSLHTLHPIVVEMALLADQFLATRLDSWQHPVTPIQGTCYLFLTSVGTCIYVRYSNTNIHIQLKIKIISLKFYILKVYILWKFPVRDFACIHSEELITEILCWTMFMFSCRDFDTILLRKKTESSLGVLFSNIHTYMYTSIHYSWIHIMVHNKIIFHNEKWSAA